MQKPLVTLLAIVSLSAAMPAHAAPPPLKLVQRFQLPAEVKGGLDHFAVDVKGNRLFLAAGGEKSVLVIDVASGRVVQTLGGFTQPNAVLYRPDLDALYVIDGTGAMRILDAATYRPVRTTRLDRDAASIGYDPATKYLYVDTSAPAPQVKTKDAKDPKDAKDAKRAEGPRGPDVTAQNPMGISEGPRSTTSALFNMIDTSSGYKGTDMTIDGVHLGAMALEIDGPLIYLNNTSRNEVDVINRDDWRLVARWPVTMGTGNVAIALDEASHRLFVGCASGQVVVFNTEEGKEVKALPIAGGVNDLAFDPLTHRLYAACGADGGSIDVYHSDDAPDQFTSFGRVPSGNDGGTALLVPEWHRYFVAVPAHGTEPAQVLVYDTESR
ncbi:MAG: hypothetical protein KGN76_17220 [Acidobacteriota bacterium]|nr:hypothetical protein [Acidobacteriota bacterium]